MKSNDKDNRPNCNEILELSDKWRLTFRKIEISDYLLDNNTFKRILNFDSERESILELDFYHFIQQIYEEYISFETGRIHTENNKIEVEAVSLARTEPSMRYRNNLNKTKKSIFTKK